MKFEAKFGHSCEIPFLAEPFLNAHPEYNWQKPYLKDFPRGGDKFHPSILSC